MHGFQISKCILWLMSYELCTLPSNKILKLERRIKEKGCLHKKVKKRKKGCLS